MGDAKSIKERGILEQVIKSDSILLPMWCTYRNISCVSDQ